MATPLKIVAQSAEDAFLQNYRVPTDFFNIEDWIFYTAASITKFYQTMYEKEYQRMRVEGTTDEVVSFSNDFLSSQVLKVSTKDGETFAELQEPVFSFVYDQSNSGIQNVFVVEPRPSYELERGNISEFWQYETLPVTSKIFWALDGKKIILKTKGGCNVGQIRVVYVPAMDNNNPNPDAEVPDGIIADVISLTVGTMKQLGQGNVEKQTLDQNANKAFETEANLKQAKMSETMRETLTR